MPDEPGHPGGILFTGHDVTVSKKTETTLRDSESRFRLLYENTPVGYQLLNEEGFFVEVNQVWLDNLGYSRGEVIGRWFGDFLPPQYVEIFRHNLPLFLDTGEMHDVQFEMVHKDGSNITVAFEGKVGCDDQGLSRRLYCVFQDITEQRWLQAALTASEKRFRHMVKHAPVGIVETDTDGNYILVNEYWCNLSGFGIRQASAKGWLAAVHPDDRQKVWRQWSKAIQHGSGFSREYRFLRWDGSVRWVSSLLIYLRNDLDKVNGCICTVVDITERYQREEDLGESEARYRALIEQASDAVALYNPETGQYVEANKRFYQMTGYTQDDLGQLSIYELIAEPEESVDRSLSELLDKGISTIDLRRLHHRDGSIIITERSAAAVQYRGKELFMVTYRDVTEQRRLEDELRREVAFAAKVQRQLLPVNALGRYETISTIYEPHRLASGDFFNYMWNKTGSVLRGYIADSTGHGIGTALQTAALNVLMQGYMEKGLAPQEVLRQLNLEAGRYFSDVSFAAVLYFEFDYIKRRLTYVSGGINYFLASSRHLNGVVKVSGPLIGVSTKSVFVAHTVSIQQGDTFYFMTDGLFELLPRAGVNNLHDLEQSEKMLRQLAISPERWDDASALCLQITDSIRWPQRFHFAKKEEYEQLRKRIAELLCEADFKTGKLLEVALNEAVNNALEHGSGEITLHINVLLDKKLVIRVKDCGSGFTVNRKLEGGGEEGAQLKLPSINQERGRGIYIMRGLTDALYYNRSGNEILMMKRIKVQT